MSKYKLLLAGISLIAVQNTMASNIDDESAYYVSTANITNQLVLEDSVFKEYVPTDVNGHTFQGFKQNKTIQIGDRLYDFCGGFTMSSGMINSTKKPTTKPEDILPSSQLERALPLKEALVNIPSKKILFTFEYTDAYWKNCSYSFTIQTALDSIDQGQAQIEAMLGKYILNGVHRDAFYNLKVALPCIVDNKNVFFVNGTAHYENYDSSLNTPKAALPEYLPLNGLRTGYTLTHLDFDSSSGTALLTYKYPPCVYYPGNAKDFSVTVGVAMNDIDYNFTKYVMIDRVKLAAKVKEKAAKIYNDICDSNQKGFLSNEDFVQCLIQTMNLRQSFLNVLESSKLRLDTKNQASNEVIQSKFESLEKMLDPILHPFKIVKIEPTEVEKREIINNITEDLIADIETALSEDKLSVEFADELINGIRAENLRCLSALYTEGLSRKQIHKSFDFWESKLEMATSPLSLMLRGHEMPNIFEMARDNKGLSVVTDSIDTFAAASDL